MEMQTVNLNIVEESARIFHKKQYGRICGLAIPQQIKVCFSCDT